MQLRTFVFVITVFALGVSALAQTNAPYRLFEYPVCRNPHESLKKFTRDADFYELLVEQTTAARAATTPRQAADRLICSAEAYLNADKGVVRDGGADLQTVSRRIFSRGRIIATNILLPETGAPLANAPELASQIMKETFEMATPYTRSNGASFARLGIKFAEAINKIQSPLDSQDTKHMILLLIIQGLYSDLNDDAFRLNYGKEILSIRTLSNSKNPVTVSELESTLSDVIASAKLVKKD